MNKADEPTTFRVAGHTVAHHVVSNIRKASSDTGVSFSYLMAQAGKESAFQPDVGSRRSSAAGLFQFTRSTWLSLIKRHGATYGLEGEAAQIRRTTKGDYVVDDPAARQRILEMRRDAQLSAQMAGEYAKDNKVMLERTLGRGVDSTDLYLAHFLGPGGAARVLKAKAADPSQPAAAVVPGAAGKNPSVFYDTNHTPRSVAELYDRVHHAIDKPMKQYARLENGPQATGHVKGTAHRADRAGEPDLQWPFETGQWPPAVPPPTVPTDEIARVEEPPAPATPATVTNVNGTLSWQSADRVSLPMPPPAAEKNANASAPGRAADMAQRDDAVAASSWQSADRVSLPMPPPAEEKSADASALGRMLRTVRRSLLG